MTKPAITPLAPMALSLTLLAGGCAFHHPDTNPSASVPPIMGDTAPPDLACPWVLGEHDRPAVKLPDPPGALPPSSKTFVPGCAIVRFTVSPDGSVAMAALRAANPLNDGPTALSAVQQMRFQPARNPSTAFVIRLGMRRDSAGRPSITPETKPATMLFWNFS